MAPSQRIVAAEPMGIVISRGEREDGTPKFAAYIWGPAPEPPRAQPDAPKT